MQRHVLFNIGRVLLGAALLNCVGSDSVSGPRSEGSAVGVPPAGPMSAHLPIAGPRIGNGPVAGATSPSWPGSDSKAVTIPPSSALLTSADAPGRLLWQKPSTEEHSIWVLNATTLAPSFVLLPTVVPTGWMIVGTGDFDGDGNADIVWENVTSVPAQRSVWFMNGNVWDGRYAMLESAPVGWSIAAVGDFNADGKPDLVWQHTTTGERGIWFMNGATVDHYGALPQEPVAWQIVGAGDFNGDGRTDLVWENLTESRRDMRRSIWFMNGGTWTQQYVLLNSVDVPDGWSIATVGDVDGNGKSDLVWQRTTTGERSVWLMNGTTVDRFVGLQSVPAAWDIAGVLATATPLKGGVKAFTVTTGTSLDATGYTIALCCTHSQFGDLEQITDIGINTFGGFSNLAPGTYTLTLGAIASNCSTPNNPRTVTVTAGVTTETTFNVVCGSSTTGSISITTITTGASPDPDGYTLNTSKTVNFPIGANSTVTISGFTPGTQSVGLNGIASNCTTTSNPRNVTVTAGATTPTTFNISCAFAPTATRFQNDASYDVIYLTIDGVQQIPAGYGILAGTAFQLDLPPGSHTYEARTGHWEGNTRFEMYTYSGSFTQQSGALTTVIFPEITIRQLLAQFRTTGRWAGEYWVGTNGPYFKIFTFNTNGTWTLTDNGAAAGSGSYSEVSRVPFIIDFKVGASTTQRGTYNELYGYFTMGNGPAGWTLIQYNYLGP